MKSVDVPSGRDFSLALSFVTLVFARLWGTVLNLGNHYFYRYPPHWTSFALPLVGSLFVACLLGRAAHAARRSSSRAARPLVTLALLAGISIGLNALRQQTSLGLMPIVRTLGWTGTWLLLGLTAVGGVLAVAWWHRPLLRAVVVLLLCLVPFAVLTLAQAAFHGLSFAGRQGRAFLDQPAAQEAEAPILQRRAVVLVFDALDQQALVEERTPGLELPGFDSLLSRSVHAQRAYPISSATALSMPALVTGRRVVDTKRLGASDLRLSFDDGTSQPWSRAAGVFDRVDELGGRSAVVGWYHPYCRILGQKLSRCSWYAYVPDPFIDAYSSATTLARLVVETVPTWMRPRWSPIPTDSTWHAQQTRAVLADAVAFAGDPGLNLVFVHFPIPHPPYIPRAPSTPGSYDDNLLLADDALREIMNTIAAGDKAESTALFVTADHYWRRSGWRDRGELKPEIGRSDHRIPFLVKLPHQESEVAVPDVLEHLILPEMVLAFLRGEIETPTAARDWMSARGLAASARSAAQTGAARQ